MFKLQKNMATIFKVGLIVVGLIGVSLFVSLEGGSKRIEEPLISDEVNRYLLLEFIPKYRFSDCSVRFAVHSKNETTPYHRELNNFFLGYVSKYEPKIGFVYFNNIVPMENFLHFADQCDRRDAIFQSMMSQLEDQYGGVFFIEHLPLEKPREPFENLGFQSFGMYWLDSPDYDQDYWPTFHGAMRGNGEAFLALVDFVKQNDHHLRHLYLALAEFYLPNGALKDKAREGKEGAWGGD